MQWSFGVGIASAAGLAQGTANVTNNATDAVIGVINLPGKAYNNTIGWIPGAPIAPYVPSPDWSNGLIVEENTNDHFNSRLAGTIGITAALLAAGGPSASLPELSIPSGAPLLLATPEGALLLGSSEGLIIGGGVITPGEVASFGGINQLALNSVQQGNGFPSPSRQNADPSNGCQLGNEPKNANPIQGMTRTGSALKTDPYHAFPNVIDNFASNATATQLRSGATLY